MPVPRRVPARNRASAPEPVSDWDRALRRSRSRLATTKPSSGCSARSRPHGRTKMSPGCTRWRRRKWCRISPRISRPTRPATTSTRSPTSSCCRATSPMPALANIISRVCFIPAIAAFVVLAAQPASAQSAATSFFVTSNGIGNGGNLGGLAGADNYCQTLAQAAGAGAKTWRAYLSTQPADGKPAVNARDRIGKGPWQNSKGVVIAKDVPDLHGNNNLTKQTALTEKGEVNNCIGDNPTRNHVLTGSQPDGTAFAAGEDRTCKNWTSSTQGSAMLGHADRTGLRGDDATKSWNSSHPSRGPDGGCRQQDPISTGRHRLPYRLAGK